MDTPPRRTDDETSNACTWKRRSTGSTAAHDESDDDEESDSPDDAVPLCSVLNTVVDHIMVSPTPLEPEEYHQRPEQSPGLLAGRPPSRIRVPLLRIFGPLLRRDSPSGPPITPLQSACVHIHGAFPYLLARPVLAGPDGSNTYRSTTTTSSSWTQGLTPGGHVDWDSVAAIERILPVLTESLEVAIQSSFPDGNHHPHRQLPSAAHRVIRKITLRAGRGFYTYCPGPPAPFLRVEYYDPALRWKVKRALEKGLDLPSLYHPDPLQYDATTTHPRPEGGMATPGPVVEEDPDPEEGPLRFHCYEAHIPYTMQVFKDWNLAGSSYVHLGGSHLYFRSPLPTLPPRSLLAAPGPDSSGRPIKDEIDQTHLLFLQSNTPSQFCWDHKAPTEAELLLLLSRPPVVMPVATHLAPNLHPMGDDDDMGRKDASSSLGQSSTVPQDEPTSSHAHVQVGDPTIPLHQPSSSPEETDSGRLPVVPPLAALPHSATKLKPVVASSTRSYPVFPAAGSAPPPFWTQKSTSCDVELDCTVEAILNVYDVMKELPEASDQRRQVFWRAVPSLRDIWREERHRMSKLLPPEEDFLSHSPDFADPAEWGDPQEKKSKESIPPFTLNDRKDGPLPGAKLALEGMTRLVRLTEGLEENFRRSLRDIVDRHASSIDQVDALLRERRQGRRSEEQGLGPLDLNSASKQLTPSYDEVTEALGALGSLFNDNDTPPAKQSPNDRFRSLSQSCYDARKSGVEVLSLEDEVEMSQRVDRGDGLVGMTPGPFRHMEDFIDPETLAPYDDIDEEGDGFGEDEEDDMDERKVETLLSTMATQTLKGADNDVQDDDMESIDSLDLLANSDLKSNCSSHDDLDGSMIETTAQHPVIEYCDDEEGGKILTLPIFTPVGWIEQSKRAPTRQSVSGSSGATSLYPIPSTGSADWLFHLSKYANLSGQGRHDLSWMPDIGHDGLDVSLNRMPPTRKTAMEWCKKHGKRQLDVEEKGQAKRASLTSARTPIKESEVWVDKHEPVVFIETTDRKTSDMHAADGFIEEVLWQPSQGLMSATQDEGGATPSNNRLLQSTTPAGTSERPTKEASQQSSSAQHSSGMSDSTPADALGGIGNQGGRLWVEGRGQLKAKTRPSQAQFTCSESKRGQRESWKSDYCPCPVSVMSVEVHVQCRTGRAGASDSKTIAMTADSSRDRIFAIVYIAGRDPGGGEAFQILERGCLFSPVEREIDGKGADRLIEIARGVKASLPSEVLSGRAPTTVECVKDEHQLLLRFASVVRWKDPDMLLSWDTQGSGLGYIIERGLALGHLSESRGTEEGKNLARAVDMVRLLGRTPKASADAGSGLKAFIASNAGVPHGNEIGHEALPSEREDLRSNGFWKGSGLGAEWDERVGAGAAAASINGRLVFAAWKIIAEEVKHANASYLPAVLSSVLGLRIPFHDNLKLNEWYGHDSGRDRYRVLHHRIAQATAVLLLFDALDIIGRSGEGARLSGVEFSQSFPGIRGSQYKVEGVLLRALQSLNSEERGSKRGRRRCRSSAGELPSSILSDESKSQTQSPWKARRRAAQHPGNRIVDFNSGPVHHISERGYFFFSPSLEDTNRQEALEAQALTLEPQSGHHQDVVVVCDFTALYPSLVIAYNLCYSTCAGKLAYHSTRTEMRRAGETTSRIGPFHYTERRTATTLRHHMKSLLDENFERGDRVYTSPNGVIYVSESVVKGVLPQVLDEMLSTRAMLKKAAKHYKRSVPGLSPSILRQLEARQLALKYVANVTYGRCAMPVLADTIVELGRRTLTHAIQLANQWGKNPLGRSVKEAFQFGDELCKAVTAGNPPPVQLKLEKVYQGSIMQTKKKYCGMKFESKDQRKPTFEAKGIETIRRDQCALTQKILRNSLVTLFSKGIDAVKSYLFRQWCLILSGRLPVSDFILTGRVRSRYRGGRVGPVQAVLARRLAEADPGKLVRHKERLAYVIVATPGVTFRLRDCVLTPMELLEMWDAFTINTAYYITKHVNAALQRCLGLAPHKVDVNGWYEKCPKPRRRIHFWPVTRSGSSVMISSYFGSDICSLCGNKGRAQGRSKIAVCSACLKKPVNSFENAMRRLNESQKHGLALAQHCSRCNLCFEDASTFAEARRYSTNLEGDRTSWRMSGIVTPLANCTCVDCPITFQRHRARETEIEALSLCDALSAI